MSKHDTETTRDNISFEDEPEDFIKHIYHESNKRNDDLKSINDDNMAFYEGRDSTLKERENDPNVVRSAIYVPELKPAIDTRRSSVITKIEDREFPITFRPRNLNPTNEENENAGWIERTINEQLRECGYLSEGFSDHILASEIYRSPSTVKVGWENVYDKVPMIVEPSEKDIVDAALADRPIPKPRVVFEDRYVGGRPYVELLPPDQFLYMPNIANFQHDSEYAGHAIWVTWPKLMAMAEEHRWNKKKLKAMKDELKLFDGGDAIDDTHGDAIQANRGTPLDKGYKDNKFLVTEFYVDTYDDSGREIVFQVIMVGLKLIISNKPTPYGGIKLPFVPITANRLPNSIEGLSSVDLGKSLQKLYNEMYNSYLDGLTYNMFPPILREAGSMIIKRPKIEPGAIWDVTNIDGIKPLFTNPGELPNLPSLILAIGERMRSVLNSNDNAQGFQANQYEKATATSLRATGAERRALPTHKLYGDAMIRVAEMVLALNQQYHTEGIRFVQDLIVDVPSLTAISNPEEQKQEALLLLSTLTPLPLYQLPSSQTKVRNLAEDVIRTFKKTGVGRLVITEEELKGDIGAQNDAADAVLRKQQSQDEINLNAQLQEQEQPQTNNG